MRQWFDLNPDYFQQEKAAVAAEQSGLILEIAPTGTRVTQSHSLVHARAICRGTYALRVPDSPREYRYSITVITQSRHPTEVPTLCCNDPMLPAGILDRHIMDDGMACLGIGAEIKRKWRPEHGLIGFFKNFVSPFLAWQVYYDTYGHAAPSGQRSHGVKGIMEYYAEELGLDDLSCVPYFMKLLAKRDRPSGHLMCPCGSGKKLRDCHGAAIWHTRENIKWWHVREDLSQMGKGKTIGAA